jgi:hypothetical protein
VWIGREWVVVEEGRDKVKVISAVKVSGDGCVGR